jgi:hypothetical protein
MLSVKTKPDKYVELKHTTDKSKRLAKEIYKNIKCVICKHNLGNERNILWGFWENIC